MDYEEEGVITAINDTLKNQVAGMGLIVGKKLRMITKQPIKGPVVVVAVIDRANTSLGLDVAAKITVDVKQ